MGLVTCLAAPGLMPPELEEVEWAVSSRTWMWSGFPKGAYACPLVPPIRRHPGIWLLGDERSREQGIGTAKAR